MKQFTQKKMFFIQAMSNIHCGTGQGLDDIDLLTAKEAATGFPLIPGSTIKGVLRDHFTRLATQKQRLDAAFGPEFTDMNEEQFASAIMMTDARLLLLPVRSFTGVFAYVTCPLVLRRLTSDLAQAGIAMPCQIPSLLDEQACVPANSANLIEDQLLLEDLDIKSDTKNSQWYQLTDFLVEMIFDQEWAESVAKSRLTLISDNVFAFLCTTALPVAARIKLNPEKGVVERGGLWYEESVPAEAVLTGLIAATDSYTKPVICAAEILQDFAANTLTLQLGGMATTGKGICSMKFN